MTNLLMGALIGLLLYALRRNHLLRLERAWARENFRRCQELEYKNQIVMNMLADAKFYMERMTDDIDRGDPDEPEVTKVRKEFREHFLNRLNEFQNPESRPAEYPKNNS